MKDQSNNPSDHDQTLLPELHLAPKINKYDLILDKRYMEKPVQSKDRHLFQFVIQIDFLAIPSMFKTSKMKFSFKDIILFQCLNNKSCWGVVKHSFNNKGISWKGVIIKFIHIFSILSQTPFSYFSVPSCATQWDGAHKRTLVAYWKVMFNAIYQNKMCCVCS